MTKQINAGYQLALVSSILLLIGGILMAVTIGFVGLTTGLNLDMLDRLIHESPLPLMLYGIWGLGIFGTVGAIAAIALLGFRARWFWRCLVITCCLWLVFPPIHMVIGLLALIILIRFHNSFPPGKEPITAAP